MRFEVIQIYCEKSGKIDLPEHCTRMDPPWLSFPIDSSFSGPALIDLSN